MNQFTVIVQNQIDEFWKKRIQISDFEREGCVSGRDVRQYLNDRSRLNTIGFVIRRSLQRKMPELLERVREKSGQDYADLIGGLNREWPEEFNRMLSRELYLISKQRGIVLSAAAWNRYLSNTAHRLNGDTLFRIAFALQMTVDETQELMLASGQDTYCMRNPEHLIFYYCQRKPNAFSWIHAQKLIGEFNRRCGDIMANANDAHPGMTVILHEYVDDLVNDTKPEKEADEELLAFMTDWKDEFSSLTLTRREDLLRMAEYLACLYPEYYARGELRPVTCNAGGVNLDELVRALFADGGWIDTTVSLRGEKNGEKGKRTSSSIKRRESISGATEEEKKRNKEADTPFLNHVQFFVDHLSQHLAAVERVFRSPENTQNVDRRDVILFTYFFIRQYPEMVRNEEDYAESLDRLTALVHRDQPLDRCMDELMDMLYNLSMPEDEEMKWDYMPMFNLVLKHFNMYPMYLPSPYDRFIYMSLLAEDPGAFTEAVMWNLGAESDTAANAGEEEADRVMENLIRRKPALLRLRNGEHASITSTRFAIGRYSPRKLDGSNADQIADYGFVTSNGRISRRHALILFDGEQFWLADISKVSHSSNANRTRVNGIPAEPNGKESEFAGGEPRYLVPLKDGDRIAIYEEEFEFCVE